MMEENSLVNSQKLELQIHSERFLVVHSLHLIRCCASWFIRRLPTLPLNYIPVINFIQKEL